ncbi:MAG: nucleotide modification associated domain-containing protein [Patescibacteria group bacterium]
MNIQPKFLDEAFAQVTKHMLTVFLKKHRDYGKGNILDTGELGIIFRINDKINRLKNLQNSQNQPENESVDDNWIDIAVYAVIAILLRRGWFKDLNVKS